MWIGVTAESSLCAGWGGSFGQRLDSEGGTEGAPHRWRLQRLGASPANDLGTGGGTARIAGHSAFLRLVALLELALVLAAEPHPFLVVWDMALMIGPFWNEAN